MMSRQFYHPRSCVNTFRFTGMNFADQQMRRSLISSRAIELISITLQRYGRKKQKSPRTIHPCTLKKLPNQKTIWMFYLKKPAKTTTMRDTTEQKEQQDNQHSAVL